MAIRKATGGFYPQTNKIIKEFEKLMGRGFDRSRIFNDWLDIMLYAFQLDDENYFKVIHKYKDENPIEKRNIDIFADMTGLLMLGMKETDADLLGDFFQCQITFGENGQYFTPQNICDFMAKIVSGKKEQPMVNDCACGSGRMLLAYNKLNPDAYFIGQDLDIRCVKMCALNCLFFNMNATIQCVNTLSNDKPFRVWKTQKSYLGGRIKEVVEEDLNPPLLSEVL